MLLGYKSCKTAPFILFFRPYNRAKTASRNLLIISTTKEAKIISNIF